LITPIKPVEIRIALFPEYDNKDWIEAIFILDGKMYSWIFALRELGAIIRGIGQLEDIKYPKGWGRRKTLQFLEDCLLKPTSLTELMEKHQIPKRGNHHRLQITLL